MSLTVGIVGLPNAGKSTLFNALASRRLAETDIRPFTTIDPHEAVVEVPDNNLQKLANLIKPDKIVPATITFIDIAGLIKGAHMGEGLGNQFLGKIREVDVIVHVLREFEDESVSHVHSKIDPEEDKEIVEIELELGGIKDKPTIYVVNCEENKLSNTSSIRINKGKGKKGFPVVKLCAKLEEELIDFDQKERKEYLQALGIRQQALDKLINMAYQLLGLITFYTIKGGKEIRAVSIKKGSSAIEAAAAVHTDFAKNFIKAEVISIKELLGVGSRLSGIGNGKLDVGGGEKTNVNVWSKAKEKGKIRLEGKKYVVKDGDVIEFKVNV